MKVGKDPANRDLGASGAYTFDEVAVSSTQAPDLQVCTGSNIGESCSSRAAAPGMVKCFASSTDTIDVEWEAANSQGDGLLTGYRVIAFDREDQVVAFVSSIALTESDCKAAARRQGLSIGGAGWAFSGDFVTKGCYTYSAGEFAGHAFYGTGGTEDQLSEKPSCALLDDGIIRTWQLCLKVRVGMETRVTFTRGAANENQRVKHGVRYSVQVNALYDKTSITSKTAICIVPQDGLPCIPPLSAASTTNIGEQVGTPARLSKRGASDCPCMTSTQVYDQLTTGTFVCVCSMYCGTVCTGICVVSCIVF